MKLSRATVLAALVLTASSFVIPRDASCASSDDCEADLYCKDGACKPLGQAGDQCDTNDDCGGELPCTNNICGTGGSDSPTLQPAGGPCSEDNECEDALACLAEVCKALQPLWGPCTVDEECEGTLFCSEGTCVKTVWKPRPEGDPCTTDDECEYGLLCKAEVCTSRTPCSNVSDILFPDSTSIYHVDSGAIDFDVGRGLVSKIQGSGADTSALVTFAFPDDVTGKQCTFLLELDSPARHTVYASGSQRVDIFSSLYPAGGDRDQWGPGNGRNEHMGRMHIVDGGFSTAEWGLTFPCPDSQTLGFEVVATGDSQHVEWWEPEDGLRVQVLA